jgi:hypothetical protein
MFRSLLQPSASDWFGRFRTVPTLANDFQIDRDVQRRNRGQAGYSGIASVPIQDQAVQDSMGAVCDRPAEHLGSSDVMIIRVRRRLLAAVRALLESGTPPPGVDDPAAYRLRSGGVFLPESANWLDATAELRRAFLHHTGLDESVAGPTLGA